MNKIVVLFQEGLIPRIYKNPINTSELEELGIVLINPKIPKNIPPHKWYHKDGKILVSEERVAEQLRLIPELPKEKSGIRLEQDINQLGDRLDSDINNLCEDGIRLDSYVIGLDEKLKVKLRELDNKISTVDSNEDADIIQVLEIIKKSETIIIDKYKFLCNITILGFFILLFLVLYIDTIKQIFERL